MDDELKSEIKFHEKNSDSFEAEDDIVENSEKEDPINSGKKFDGKLLNASEREKKAQRASEREQKKLEREKNAQERERKNAERGIKAAEREQKKLDREKNAQEREQKKVEREIKAAEREQKKLEREKNAQKREHARIMRENNKRQKMEIQQGRICKGTCGKYRPPPNFAKKSRWFVCYGCKNYSLCLKCGAENSILFSQFENHAKVCDPFYSDRISQCTPAAVFPAKQDKIQEQPNDEDGSEEYDPLFYAERLSRGAQKLLDFYEPKPRVPLVPPDPFAPPSISPTPTNTYEVESTYKGCWTGESLIFKFDGTRVRARDVVPGDKLLSSIGTCAVVNAVIISTVDCDVKIVEISSQCHVTRGHPVYDFSNGQYFRADFFGTPSVRKIHKLYNFELQRDCVGLLCGGGVIAATVGNSFNQIKRYSDVNDTMWGENYWTSTRILLRKNLLKNITYLRNPMEFQEAFM